MTHAPVQLGAGMLPAGWCWSLVLLGRCRSGAGRWEHRVLPLPQTPEQPIYTWAAFPGLGQTPALPSVIAGLSTLLVFNFLAQASFVKDQAQPCLVSLLKSLLRIFSSQNTWGRIWGLQPHFCLLQCCCMRTQAKGHAILGEKQPNGGKLQLSWESAKLVPTLS